MLCRWIIQIVCLVALIALPWPLIYEVNAQEAGGRQIRVAFKADDMGAAHGINVGTIEAYQRGVVTSTDVIVPGPWFMEAVKLLGDNPGLDVGIHLTLTSEWESIKWRPLTAAQSFVDRDGYFFPMVWPNSKFPPGSAMMEAKLDLQEVERELRAQIETARRLIPRVSFLSAHMGAVTATPELRTLVRRLSRGYNLPLQEDAQQKAAWLRDVYASTDSGEVKGKKLAQRLESLSPGTYIHLDHAGVDTPEMRALGHEGYRHVAQDRSANLQAWTSGEVKNVIKRRGIELIRISALLPHRD